jgi:hypothetical protein
VLLTTDWRQIRQHPDSVLAAVAGLQPGAYVELALPPPGPLNA